MGELTAEAMAYRARALAQAHPLSKQAKKYLDRAVAIQRTSQPVPEIGIWAGAALTEGYCVRRVEEEDLGLPGSQASDGPPPLPGVSSADDDDTPEVTFDELEAAATELAATLRSEPDEAAPSRWGHPDPSYEERLLDVLNRIVASQVSHRLMHWRDSIDDAAWAELEEYLAWWVVKGYALRVAEIELGSVTR